jgi:hypothetical protein
MSSTEEKIYVGDVGTRFNFTILEAGLPVNLTGYEGLLIEFQRPDKTKFTEELTVISLAQGRVRYTTVANTDLNQSGRWRAQLILTLPEWTGRASEVSFWVHKQLGT